MRLRLGWFSFTTGFGPELRFARADFSSPVPNPSGPGLANIVKSEAPLTGLFSAVANEPQA
jgi:hypothetical protein